MKINENGSFKFSALNLKFKLIDKTLQSTDTTIDYRDINSTVYRYNLRL